MGLVVLAAGASRGQDYPIKPIRLVTAEPQGGNDFAARIIAPGLTERMGQQIIVDNRPNGAIRVETVSKAQPDGYTLLLDGISVWLLPLLRDDVKYDPVKDIVPVCTLAMAPLIVAVHPSVAANSVKELIALARAAPGALNYSSGSSGGSGHIAAELFKAMAGVNIVRIPYKGTGPAVLGLVGGEVQLSISGVASVAPHVKSGRLRGLAVTSAKPSALLPGMPTVSASGLPGYEAGTLTGIWAPARTPARFNNKVSQELMQVLGRAEVKERFIISGSEAVGSTPAQFTAIIKADMIKWDKVFKDAGIRDE
jgi:tripartite-type tricarboxylate transporter receptor subunit TctC